MMRDNIVAFSLHKEEASSRASSSSNPQLRYSVILQGTFDSSVAREEFLNSFSNAGLDILCSANFIEPPTERPAIGSFARLLAKFKEAKTKEEKSK
ncbi:MAG: hypothetical protein WC521_05700 [Bdellovibrionales bacterium]